METLDSLETADESSGNSGNVKSEDGSPNHGNGRSSPPPNCAICLGRCRNKSFTDSCLHQFCFKCLLTWSKVKTECPLCKQNFKSIIHNVKSNNQYEEYRVQQPQSEDRGPSLDFSDIFNAARRFRYRTTLTLPRRETMAIRQFLLHYPLSALMSELPARGARERSRPAPADFRRTVYRHNLWAHPLPDFTGRFRDASPDFFRYNDSQVHRLVPWLSRELFYLLNENSAHVTYVVRRVLELLPQHPILSEPFRAELARYLGERTDHFLHEFHCFASTPYDITGYDRHVQYGTAAPAAGLVSEVLSSSDSESRDSDIVVVSSSRAATPPPAAAAAAGPSRAPPAYPQPAVIPIETISHSDSDSDPEVMVVGYLKPPHQRTPELVDLIASDSDVIVQEPDEPPPAAQPAHPAHSSVRITLSMRRPRGPPSSDGGSPSYTPPRAPPARRRRRAADCDTPYSPASAPRSSSDDYSSDDCSSRSTSSAEDARAARWRSRRKPARRARAVRRKPRDSRREDKAETPDGDRKTKGKSRNGKDVKSTKVEPTTPPEAAPVPTPALDRPGPSGLGDGSRKRNGENGPPPDLAGPSGLDLRRPKKRSRDRSPADRPGSTDFARSGKKRSPERTSRRGSRDSRPNKRLKSIVKVMKRDPSAGVDSNDGRAGRADAYGYRAESAGSSAPPPARADPRDPRPGRDHARENRPGRDAIKSRSSRTDSRESRVSRAESRESKISRADSPESEISRADSNQSRVSHADSRDSEVSRTESHGSRASEADSRKSEGSRTDSRESKASHSDSRESEVSRTDSRGSGSSHTDSHKSADNRTGSRESRSSHTDSHKSKDNRTDPRGSQNSDGGSRESQIRHAALRESEARRNEWRKERVSEAEPRASRVAGASSSRPDSNRTGGERAPSPLRTHRGSSSSDDDIPLGLALPRLGKPFSLSRTYTSDFSD